MSTLRITRGLPAAGKTTWAKAWVAEDPSSRARVNRDDLRAMMFETPDYSWPQEVAVTEAARAAVRALLASGRDVVADDTNLRPKYVREWIRFARANGAEVEVTEFPVSVEEAIARDAQRAKPVGAEVITRMAGKFLRKGHLLPIPDDFYEDEDTETGLYEPKPDSLPTVLVDIDGTLALMGDRSPYDLAKVSDDLPNRGVIEAVKAAAAAGTSIVYLSGREDSCRAATEAWLDEHVGIPGPLYMRPTDDRRKDSIVKRELFDAHIRDDRDVLYVLDDRKQVVDAWRALGLTVFQVAPGDF